MDMLKTPKQMLMEEAGVTPASPGLLKTPKQLLIEESGILPKFANGKKVKKKPTAKEMEADLLVNGKAIPKLKRKTPGKKK
jgi:hypothetical protein